MEAQSLGARGGGMSEIETFTVEASLMIGKRHAEEPSRGRERGCVGSDVGCGCAVDVLWVRLEYLATHPKHAATQGTCVASWQYADTCPTPVCSPYSPSLVPRWA